MEQVTRRSSRLKQNTQVPETTQAQIQEPVQDRGASHTEEVKRKTKVTRGKRTNKKAIQVTNALDATTLNETEEPATASKTPEPSPFRNVRGRRGFLQYMNDMPLDILYEIFGELGPVDLLHLSWSCKSVRAIVMDKRAKFLWKKVRLIYLQLVTLTLNSHWHFKVYKSLENQPPPCPPDLNYAQYTRFLFVNRCMVSLIFIVLTCNATKSRSVRSRQPVALITVLGD